MQKFQHLELLFLQGFLKGLQCKNFSRSCVLFKVLKVFFEVLKELSPLQFFRLSNLKRQSYSIAQQVLILHPLPQDIVSVEG